MGGEIIVLTEENFDEEITKSEIPVLVDFWAPWCGPCRTLAPILEEIAEEFKGRLKIGKVNVDENLRLSQKYSIQSIPTLIIFKDGKEVNRSVGAVPKEKLRTTIDSSL
ncbi:thioredoxin [Candidatus Sumerlaeota bacterium]|nr:thioredoxin [Candidatus Sumerlaeota bacterium]